jgi:Fur family transcriptional regulator, ferric uptake regulator
MKPYKTEGRLRLLSFLQAHPDQQFTVEELGSSLCGHTVPGTSVAGQSSLYRQLSALCADGTVRKYRAEGQKSFVYQYIGETDCRHHFHLKCLSCGRLVHLRCGMSQELLTHIQEEHGFRVDSGRSILYGLCRDCAASAQITEFTNDRDKDKEKI